jgi:hypothetical protein
MPTIPEFYSVEEESKPVAERVYHNNSRCPSGHSIPKRDRLAGTNGYRICDQCKGLNLQGA